MAKDLLEQLAAARARVEELQEKVKADIEERRNALDEEMKEAGLAIARRGRKSTGTRICKNCGKPGHNSRTCPEKKQKKTEQ